MTAPVDLEAEGDRLLGFARASVHPDGGFAWLDDDGRPQLDRPVELWVSCRMTHVFALAHLQGRPWAAALVDHGLAALTGRLRDHEHGGWWASVDAEGPVARTKTAYEHAFVVLAASSAAVAGRPGADTLLADALDVLDRRFWDDDAGMVVEQWDEAWTRLDAYRGVNANMHTVEALLAAGDLERAGRILGRVVHGFARSNDWRIPEHFDATWTPLPDYNKDDPAHPFRPYGATIGHWFEWSRLTLALRAALGDGAPDWMLEDARALFDAGVREGWAVDGTEGFVYTVGWDGAPVVRQRMHWVVAEALAAAETLHRTTGDPAYRICAEQWWAYADRHLIDHERGSWHHELDPANRPAAGTWVGKPDVYHAYQATLVPRLPLWPPFARALAAG
ncbi:AGE family epimerase/isomerase [Nocardioides sp.]|uniref:AGE family epimerase/isomerase n=1 Tax=Nocardioides sp. TaxID=35761 RepID=UPI0037836157